MKKMIRPIAILITAVLCFTLLFSGCGTTNSNASPKTSDTPATSQAPASAAATTSSATGDKTEIVIGYVAPFTGPLSVFTTAFDWVTDICLEKINAEGGIYIKEYDKKLPVRVIKADSESDPNKATEAATKLVLNDKVDILSGAWTPDTSVPVSSVAERYEIPSIISNSPADSWLTGGPYKWSCGVMFYGDPLLSDYIVALDKLDTNKKVGFIFDSEVDGIVFSGKLEKLLPAAGYTIVDPGRFPFSTTDYTSIISQLKQEGCDIVIGNQITPNFTIFWQQCHQLGYVPKVMIIGKAEHFMSDVVALGGELGNGVMSEVLWDKSFPFTSPLIKMSASEICAKWETEKGTQFPATIGYDVSNYEVMADALGRCVDLKPDTIMKALLATDIDSIYGHLKFDSNNVAPVPCVTCQWVKGEKWPYEKIIVGTGSTPIIPSVTPILIPDNTMGS